MVIRTITYCVLSIVALNFATASLYGSPVDSAPLARRSEIASDEIVGFPQTVPNSVLGELYLKYKPYLKVFNGCVPFPAVDADGNTK